MSASLSLSLLYIQLTLAVNSKYRFLARPTPLYILFIPGERKRKGRDRGFRGLPSGVHTHDTHIHTEIHTGYLNSHAGLFALFTQPAILPD